MGVATNPVGYMSITCLPSSDTIVGLPLRQNAAFSGTLSADPDTTTTPGSAILTLSGTPGLTVNAYANQYYVKFADTTPTPAAGDGQWFSITANAAGSITVNLNGGTIAALAGARLEVLKFWTLAELFNPADCTTLATTTGNAIVASTSTLLSGRRTEVLYPNLTTAGINLSSSATYYVHSGIWKKAGSGDTNFGATQLWPDVYFAIRQPSTVTSATVYTITGEVEVGDFCIPLGTQISVGQDNFISLTRPIDVTLDDLNLGGTSAFVSSTSTLLSGRRDQLLVFNNSVAARNRSASATYYYHGGMWKKTDTGDTNMGSTVIPAGTGFIIRKYRTLTGETVIWKNSPTY